MANTQPRQRQRAVTDYILAKARVEGVVRVHPIGAVTKNLRGEEPPSWRSWPKAGCVAFSDDAGGDERGALPARLEYTLPFGLPVISHARTRISRWASR